MDPSFTRDDLAAAVATRFDITKRDSKTLIDFIFDEMSGALSDGRRVLLAPIGSLTLVDQKPRRGWNPKTRSIEVFPKRQKVRFRPSSTGRSQ